MGLFPLLSSDAKMPLVSLEEISQTIDSENFTVQNTILFAGPLATTAITTNAKFEVRSPKRVQVLYVPRFLHLLIISYVFKKHTNIFGHFLNLLKSIEKSHDDKLISCFIVKQL